MNKDTLKESVEELKQNLWIDVMEDYIITAELGHLAKDEKAHKEEMRGHLQNLAEYISTLIEQTKKEMSDKIIEQAEKETDYKTKGGLYLAYDIINSLKGK